MDTETPIVENFYAPLPKMTLILIAINILVFLVIHTFWEPSKLYKNEASNDYSAAEITFSCLYKNFPACFQKANQAQNEYFKNINDLHVTTKSIVNRPSFFTKMDQSTFEVALSRMNPDCQNNQNILNQCTDTTDIPAAKLALSSKEINIPIAQRFWTTITYQFLQIDFWHLFSNMIALWIFGSYLERLLTPKKLLGAYLFSGIFSTIPWVIFTSGPFVLLGASGSIFGLVAITLFYDRYTQSEMLKVSTALVLLTIYLATLTFLGLNGDSVSYYGHLYGAIGGYLFLKIFKIDSDSAPISDLDLPQAS